MLSGWTISGGVSDDASFPNTGSYDAIFTGITGTNNPGPGTISQSIATTPGGAYTLNFALADESGSQADSFVVSFGGFSKTITGDDAAFGYTSESFVVPGADVTGASTVLSFKGLVDPFSGQALNLDDVSLTPISAAPEPSQWLLMFTGIAVAGLALRRSPLRRSPLRRDRRGAPALA